MEPVPFDDPQDAAIADNILQHLRHSLQLLASPAQAQLSHFPAGWVVLTDEMVLDFDAWGNKPMQDILAFCSIRCPRAAQREQRKERREKSPSSRQSTMGFLFHIPTLT
jgi:hypothetical protein